MTPRKARPAHISCLDHRPETKVGDVMTRSPKAAEVNDAAIDCLELMAAGGFRDLPVVDAYGRPLGMVRQQRDSVATTLPQALSLAR